MKNKRYKDAQISGHAVPRHILASSNLISSSVRSNVSVRWLLHIPGYPPTYSDNIRPFVPGYPPSFDALP